MLTLALATLLLAPPTERPSLVVRVEQSDEDCVGVDTPLLHASIELALGWALDHRGAAAAQAWDTEVSIACVDAGLELAIRDPQTSTHASRIVAAPTTADPKARAELLAIAVADLVRSTWHALEQASPPALDGATDHSTAASRRRARNIARRPTAPWLAGDGFVVRSYFGERAPALMLGEQVELVHRPLRNLAWKIDGELAGWRVPVEGGVVGVLALTVAPALLGYGEFGGSSRPGRPGRVAVYGGAGARLGGARLGKFGWQPLAGPMATARFEIVCHRFVRVALVGETGWLLAGPRQSEVALRGPWANGTFVIVSAF